ncbi:AlbA family DNA-binding domain-containing protein [Paenarthrobacter histidinolovorans]|uniref:AlbA family DNA-binding domain-containing protein n=1 Tax=Paenarthrobacter histidinolovorans TaxID=43664 RepID=UPI00166DFB1B|nr:hypothetical protein [Paenarthrobacter histidinolovorans]GGJ21454.1 hypothetical protein GCM10010052_18330 [Paenarthrobacter histidinolovorans]
MGKEFNDRQWGQALVAQRTVSFDDDPYREWSFGGKARSYDRHTDQLVVHRSDLDLCTATDLQWALRQAQEEGGPERVNVASVDEQYMGVEGITVEPVEFQLDGGALTVAFTFVDEFPEAEQDGDVGRFTEALQPLLSKHRATLLAIDGDDYSGAHRIWNVCLGFKLRGRKLAAMFQAGLDMCDLMDALAGGELTRETAGHLVRAGHADVLIGQPEGQWLEAKSQHYDFSTLRGEISLAQAVSRFCNSEDGGIVVIGMSTKKTPAGEHIRQLNPMPATAGIVLKYQRILENRLFPLVRDLQIDAVAAGPGSEIVLVDIPPQPEELKPFLVSGAIVDGKVDGAFISIVRRRGEGSVPTTAQEIHSTLVAGRALLRGGHFPQVHP